MMTIPGGMMQQSVDRLRDAIQAAKDAAEQTRNAVATQQVTPVTIGQGARDVSQDTGQGPA